MAKYDLTTPEGRAMQRAEDFSAVLWHIGTYVVINAFMWFIDWNAGDGIQWAFWVSIPWGIGLAFHILSYVIEDGGLMQRRYQKFLAEERETPPPGT